MSTTLTNKNVVIRKEHLCFSCHRRFPIGTKMRYWTGLVEGDFNSVYSCETCDEIIKLTPREFFDDGIIPDGFVRETLNKNQTPEELLQILKECNQTSTV